MYLFDIIRTIIITLAVILTVNTVKGSYPMTISMQEQVPGRGCAASFVRNNTLYSYGGESKSLYETYDFFSIKFNETDGSLIYSVLPQANYGPIVSCSTAILLPDDNTVLLIGGGSLDTYQNNGSETDILLLYQFTFHNQRWTSLPVNVDPQAISANTTLLPSNRYGHTSTMAANGLIYIYGGASLGCTGAFVSDAWVYNHTAALFTPFQTLNNIGLCGHVAVSLPNGIIWYSHGVLGLGGTHVNSSFSHLTGANTSMLFNTSNGTWSLQTIEGFHDDTSTNVHSSAVLGPDKRHIYMFGGTDFDTLARRLYRSSIDVLDTVTWEYVVSDKTPIAGLCPSLREMAISAVMLDKYLVIGLGIVRTQYYNDFNVMYLPQPDQNGNVNFSNLRWVSNIITNDVSKKQVSVEKPRSSGSVAAIIVSIWIVTITIVVLLAWKLRHQTYKLSTYIIQLVWEPRYGEPNWTEAISLATKAVLTCLYIVIFIFLIRQVLHSPFGTVSIVQPVEYVRIPDVRFCFNGFGHIIESFEISCITGGSVDCNRYVRPLDTKNHIPFILSSNGRSICYLFTTTLDDNDLKLASINNPKTNNGTNIHFTFFSTMIDSANGTNRDSKASVIHVSVYPPDKNPNHHFLEGASRPESMSDKDFENWLLDDARGLIAKNVFNLYEDEEALVQYELATYEYLSSNSTRWNYVGIAPVLDPVPEVAITYRIEDNFREDRDPPGIRSAVGEVTLVPKRYVVVNVREQQIYTLVNSLGFAGGVLGLFIAAHVLLFGSRPGSPWGIVQRFSVGRSRHSLYYALGSSYKTVAASIPFVSPVHPRFLESSKKRWKNASQVTVQSDETLDVDGYQDKPSALPSSNVEIKLREANARIESLEERIQLLETMFKSYYINDELFGSLERATDQSFSQPFPQSKSWTQSLRNRFSKRSKKVQDRSSSSAEEECNESSKLNSAR